VADWRPAEAAERKLKKTEGAPPPEIALTPNPDILRRLSQPGAVRPTLVIGFAAETDDLLANAGRKLAAKRCDWILANDVSAERGTFGSVSNRVHLLRAGAEPEPWPEMDKAEVAARLATRIAAELGGSPAETARAEMRPEDGRR
jgi:phosphopantothenoylcysteine decarboxylase/phosphopantothenate--cysteine ligase